MSIIARQFARPHGLLGRVLGLGMARFNAEFSRWVIHQAAEHGHGEMGDAGQHELEAIRGCLRPGGLLVLGYQLRQNMPSMAEKHFPSRATCSTGPMTKSSACYSRRVFRPSATG